MFASALSVALTGQRTAPTEYPADFAESQGQIDIRERIVDTLRVLLRPWAVSTIAACASPRRCAAETRSASATPVSCSTRSGQ